jgi:hypothetical protein
VSLLQVAAKKVTQLAVMEEKVTLPVVTER